jgi:hypothetical protein
VREGSSQKEKSQAREVEPMGMGLFKLEIKHIMFSDMPVQLNQIMVAMAGLFREREVPGSSIM